MITKTELITWLDTLPPETEIAILEDDLLVVSSDLNSAERLSVGVVETCEDCGELLHSSVCDSCAWDLDPDFNDDEEEELL